MKALSIKQPHAERIAAGVKRIENRSWRTNFRGQLAIHVSARRSSRDTLHLCAGHGLEADELTYSAIIAVVDVVDCVTLDELHSRRRQRALFPELEELEMSDALGPWCWLLENVRRFDKPIPIVGGLSLWNVPESIERKIKRKLRAK